MKEPVKKNLNARKHGMSFSPTYYSWAGMIQRCKNKKKDSYKYYGNKGVGVCGEWLKFDSFLKDMGVRPDGMTLDRIDNSIGYCPQNCRWATYKNQTLNRGVTRFITHKGETLCASDWSKRLGGDRNLVLFRIKRGWPEALAVSSKIKINQYK